MLKGKYEGILRIVYHNKFDNISEEIIWKTRITKTDSKRNNKLSILMSFIEARVYIFKIFPQREF